MILGYLYNYEENSNKKYGKNVINKTKKSRFKSIIFYHPNIRGKDISLNIRLVEVSKWPIYIYTYKIK